MAYRHFARSLVLQTLFACDFHPGDEAYATDTLQYVIHDFGAGSEDQAEFLQYLLVGVLRKKTIIDEIIQKAAPEWPLEKINAVDRNVLRLGLFELLFGNYDQVPPKVAINEAIELAKAFGGESSGRFVNGVLGAVYKEIGEPGKDQVGKKKDMTADELEKLVIEKKAGAVIYSMVNGVIALAMVHDIFGFWTLSKGSVPEGESPEDSITREVMRETGLPVQVIQKLGENEYIANHPEKGRVRKQVSYYLVEAPYQQLRLGTPGGLDDAKWFTAEEVLGLRMYDDVTRLIAESIEIISSQS